MTKEIINQTEQPAEVAPVIVSTKEMMEKYFEMTGLKLDPAYRDWETDRKSVV